MKNKKRAAALALAAIMACGGLAGCDALTTTNISKDYQQVIAEVDLSKSTDFQEGGKYAAYKDIVGKTSIVKRDMVASYVSNGYSVQQQYGWSYLDTFNAICDSLVNRQVYVQYAKVYLAENGGLTESERYTVEGYKAAVAGAGAEATEAAKEAAGLEYFLTEAERDKALYDLRVSVNDSLDSIEEGIISLAHTDEEETSTETVRTLPTGADTENEDYYNKDYAIYTGSSTIPSGYEKVENSTPTTRRKAYTQYLAQLRANNLLDKGENTADFEGMTYFAMQKKSFFESALVDKMSKKLEQEAEEKLTKAWLEACFNEDLEADRASYQDDKTSFETAFDAISDSSFVFAAPQAADGSYENYGYVINILLPFSTVQTEELNGYSSDLGDAKGNKYAARAKLLQNLKATDQRGTWFTGETDYSYKAETADGAFTGGNTARQYLFFENSIKNAGEGKQYEALKNYYGKYTYNGTVTAPETEEDEYVLKPNKISIDGFLSEMKDYLTSVGTAKGFRIAESYKEYNESGSYYDTAKKYYNDDGTVDYSKFIYAEGKIESTDGDAYDINSLFDASSWENAALSVINELSFAYNTDTAGLNTYLGYSISPFKTSYMPEFEYAAQRAVKNGAGSFNVVPTDYGWHIIYCTFSFHDTPTGANSPYAFNYADIEKEGTFSYNYFEARKADAVSAYSTNMQTAAINEYVDACTTVYNDRFADLTGLDSQS